jgi:hypothetical protein
MTSPEQKRKNRSTALIMGSIALAFFLGVILRRLLVN